METIYLILIFIAFIQFIVWRSGRSAVWLMLIKFGKSSWHKVCSLGLKPTRLNMTKWSQTDDENKSLELIQGRNRSFSTFDSDLSYVSVLTVNFLSTTSPWYEIKSWKKQLKCFNQYLHQNISMSIQIVCAVLRRLVQ